MGKKRGEFTIDLTKNGKTLKRRETCYEADTEGLGEACLQSLQTGKKWLAVGRKPRGTLIKTVQ